MEILSLILNFLLASGLAGTLIFFRYKRRQAKAAADSADLENTDRIIQMQTAHIGRLDVRVEKLEEKVDKLEVIIEDKDGEIGRRAAFRPQGPMRLFMRNGVRVKSFRICIGRVNINGHA